MPEPIIRLEDVSFTYEEAKRPAVRNVTLEVPEGQFLAVLGRNGSGKSTLAKLLNALILPDKGLVEVGGRTAKSEEEAFSVREVCGMVFQNPDNQIVTTIVEEDCAFGLENLGVDPEVIRRRVDETLEEVGMKEHAKSSPSMLSGGQKQRVAIAGVLAMRPRIIVFDESTAMLDPVGRGDILSLAHRLNREEGITVVWITHFMGEAVTADRVVVMDMGQIVLDGTPAEVFENDRQILSLGLEVPEMLRLRRSLEALGVGPIRPGTMTIEEMAEEICRLR